MFMIFNLLIQFLTVFNKEILNYKILMVLVMVLIVVLVLEILML